MKITLDHLPPDKIRQLARMVQSVIDAIAVEKIILLDPCSISGWLDVQVVQQDVMLIVTGANGENKSEYRLNNDIKYSCQFDTPVTTIIHSIEFVNARLKEANPFFSSMVREGTCLFDAGIIPLVEVIELGEEEKTALEKKIAVEYEYWSATAGKLLNTADQYLEENDMYLALLMLYQGVIHIYNGVLFWYWGTIPREQHISTLRKICEVFSADLAAVFSTDHSPDNYPVLLINRGIDISYYDYYRLSHNLSTAELRMLREKAGLLQDIARSICRRR
ncbi:hypothetical protein [Chitinophaga varians]|uniref:hypothetical protein n=1 Tax=Chitinophaga varians TaxID=2202339 RepID=UPI00165F35EE|nr:hypothetical protein [Chitinophaga varians]MBC9915510.1 hypothetical protein [Chitinophaga varians]